MTVHFIGAGPGAPDLITVRGLRLIERCPVCLYAGSLVPVEILASAPPGALVIDTAPLTLDEIVGHLADADIHGLDVARLHSGDPSLYGAIAEQMRRLEALGIPFDVTPGVPSFAAAAAALGRELTLPEIAQTVILTRTATRSSPMPEREALERLGASGAGFRSVKRRLRLELLVAADEDRVLHETEANQLAALAAEGEHLAGDARDLVRVGVVVVVDDPVDSGLFHLRARLEHLGHGNPPFFGIGPRCRLL